VRIEHDGTVLNFSVTLKEGRDTSFAKAWGDSRDEKVGSSVGRAFFVLQVGQTGIFGRWWTSDVNMGWGSR